MVAAAIDWSSIQVAGAFIVGAVAGTVATLRITRHVLEYVRRERRQR